MSTFGSYTESLIPPYTARDLIPLLATFFFLLSIFLTLLLLKERKDNRGHASEVNAVEAEEAILFGPVVLNAQSDASGGQFIQFLTEIPGITQQAAPQATCPQVTQRAGMATVVIEISETNTYNIWTRMMKGEAEEADAYILEIDGKCMDIGGGEGAPTPLKANEWVWTSSIGMADLHTQARLKLDQGSHVIRLFGTQPGVKIDRMLFTPNLSCVPSGTAGENCNGISPTRTAQIAS